MPHCAICLQERATLKFRTGRLSICGFCVRTLNTTRLSPRQAEIQWRADFRNGIVHGRPDAVAWVDGWLEKCGGWIIAERLENSQRVRRSPELKIMRAYRGGLICLDRRYLAYPTNWEFKRFRLKHWHNDACYQCGAREADGAVLHAHHIVHRMNSGTNSYRNLVTLCLRHHQEHHEHPIGLHGGEPSGPDVDDSVEELDLLWSEPTTTMLPKGFDELAYSTARPTFEAALNAFRTNGKSMRELFVFLIQTFGSNVGRYALRFAEEERLSQCLSIGG